MLKSLTIIAAFIATLTGCSLSPSAEFVNALANDGAGYCVAAGVQTPVPYAGSAGFDVGRLNKPGKVTISKDGTCTIEIYKSAE